MFNNVYEHTPWKFTTLRDGTARFCRECKFVSCYLHKVERRHNRFRRAPDEKGSLVFKTFKICNVDGTAITSYRYRATQLGVLINAIILFNQPETTETLELQDWLIERLEQFENHYLEH